VVVIRFAAIVALLLFAGGAIGGIAQAQWRHSIFGAASKIVIPPHPISISPVNASANDTTLSGTTLAGFVVTMSDASTFTGTIADLDGSGLTQMSGYNLVAARNFVGTDDGTHNFGIRACQGGNCLQIPFALAISANSSVACMHGPNASSAPAPASHAGFNTCLLNADFQSSTTDSFGTNYSNTATYIVNCGASPTSDDTVWTLGWFVSPYGYFDTTPCSRAQIVTDPVTGTTALDQSFLTGDNSGFPGCCPGHSGPLLTALHWPTTYSPGGPHGGPVGNGLWQAGYYQITFRYPSAVLSYPGSGIMSDWWMEQSTAQPVDIEADFFELQPAFNSGNNYHLMTNDAQNSSNPFADAAVDATDNQYHTYGVLMTFNGSARAMCGYLDGGIATATPVGCSGPFSISNSDYSAQFANSLTNWVGFCDPSDPNHNCITTNSHMYIRDIQGWTCSTPWNGPCTGSLITSMNEETKPRHFAWLGRIGDYLRALLVTPARADGFDRPFGQTWVCPDGRAAVHGACIPPEFRGAEWWKACLPSRSDCVHSDTAFLGHDQMGLAIRGPGYCYTGQPYTCSPLGAPQ
jgi:hypothetical protein